MPTMISRLPRLGFPGCWCSNYPGNTAQTQPDETPASSRGQTPPIPARDHNDPDVGVLTEMPASLTPPKMPKRKALNAWGARWTRKSSAALPLRALARPERGKNSGRARRDSPVFGASAVWALFLPHLGRDGGQDETGGEGGGSSVSAGWGSWQLIDVVMGWGWKGRRFSWCLGGMGGQLWAARACELVFWKASAVGAR